MNMQKLKCWALLSLVITLSACSRRNVAAPEPLALDQVQPMITSAFANANADVHASATQFVQYVLNQDFANALTELQQLRANPGLSPKQRTLLARAMMTTTRELQAGAASGDQLAAQALHDYRSQK